MKTSSNIGSFVRTYAGILAAISLLAIYQTQVQTQALLKLHTRYKWAALMLVLAVIAAGCVYVALRRQTNNNVWNKLSLGKLPRALGPVFGAALMLLPAPLFLFARSDFYGQGIEAFFRLLWLFWCLALVQATGMKLATGLDWPRAFGAMLLLDGVIAQLYTLSAAVSAYPFSMGWSEASRYYYGSLVFAKSIYGMVLPLSVMHGTRYLLQSLPFLIGGGSLWVARLWQVLLWIVLTAGSSWAIVRRLRLTSWFNTGLIIAWLFLFFFEGAVYYHLQVCVIIIMLGTAPGKPWRSLVAVIAASVWAGMSRVNWFPVPAMLAITLYVLETPLEGSGGWWRYLRVPVVWAVAGVGAALAGQASYVAISGNTNLEAFASSFTSALLWYRWLPSATNPIGILPGVIIVTAPVAALLYWSMQSAGNTLHVVRKLILAAMLLVLLVGGLVVSTKIGGGGDLHNMDAYLVMLGTLGAYSLCGTWRSEQDRQTPRTSPPLGIMILMAVVPVAFTLLRLASPFRYDAARVATDLSTLRAEVEKYRKSGDVLFMYERQLLTFGMIPGVRVVPEDDVVTLMEMAISGNEPYLEKYYEDLQGHRFAAIVAHPQNLGVETGDFIEENDAWNRLVGQPLLCQYKPALTLSYSKIQILVPRARPCLEFPPRINQP